VDTAAVHAQLAELGFSEGMYLGPVASLSGGWKMKLALARAMLYRAQIMLLDEPTNHLDVKVCGLGRSSVPFFASAWAGRCRPVACTNNAHSALPAWPLHVLALQGSCLHCFAGRGVEEQFRQAAGIYAICSWPAGCGMLSIRLRLAHGRRALQPVQGY
jgi:hypothetical protein